MERDKESRLKKKLYSAFVCAVCGTVLVLFVCGAAIYKLACFLKGCR